MKKTPKHIKTTTQLREQMLETHDRKARSIMDSMRVLSPEIRDYIMEEYWTARARVSKMRITEKSWPKLTREELWREHDEMESQLQNLRIFSDDFYSILYRMWYEMLNAFNPNVTYK